MQRQSDPGGAESTPSRSGQLWRQLLAFAALLVVILGAVVDLHDVQERWKEFDGPLPDALHISHDDQYSRALGLSLLLLVAFLLLVGFLLFQRVYRYLFGGDRREAVARGLPIASVRQERARRAYLDYLSDELHHRLRSSIHHARFIDLELEEAPDATLPWHYVSHAPEDPARSFPTIADAYAHYGGRFLILGDPGSGKTTSLLHLARRLVDTARRDRQAPIPVLLNLSSFDAGPRAWWSKPREPPEPGASFQQWLTRELSSSAVAGPRAHAPLGSRREPRADAGWSRRSSRGPAACGGHGHQRGIARTLRHGATGCQQPFPRVLPPDGGQSAPSPTRSGDTATSRHWRDRPLSGERQGTRPPRRAARRSRPRRVGADATHLEHDDPRLRRSGGL